jgi:hypothetical protein
MLEEIEAHREFLLSALRSASLRCKLADNELTTIGVALKNDLIGPDTAVQWIRDHDLMWLIGPLPKAVGQIAEVNIGGEDNAS